MTKDRRIARDYYTTSLTRAQIKQKYGVTEAYVKETADKYDYKGFYKEREYSLVKVDREQLEAALMLLRDASIHHYAPEHFQLTEYYESKINHDDETL